jgi:hypothetical protein
LRRQLGVGLSSLVVIALAALGVFATPVPADEGHGDPVGERGDRYIPQPAGTKSKYDFWFGP